MSACYTIELNMKFNSPESMSDAVRSLQEYIKKDAGTDYDLESYAADGIGTENIDDLMKIFLSDRKRQRMRECGYEWSYEHMKHDYQTYYLHNLFCAFSLMDIIANRTVQCMRLFEENVPLEEITRFSEPQAAHMD